MYSHALSLYRTIRAKGGLVTVHEAYLRVVQWGYNVLLKLPQARSKLESEMARARAELKKKLVTDKEDSVPGLAKHARLPAKGTGLDELQRLWSEMDKIDKAHWEEGKVRWVGWKENCAGRILRPSWVGQIRRGRGDRDGRETALRNVLHACVPPSLPFTTIEDCLKRIGQSEGVHCCQPPRRKPQPHIQLICLRVHNPRAFAPPSPSLSPSPLSLSSSHRDLPTAEQSTMVIQRAQSSARLSMKVSRRAWSGSRRGQGMQNVAPRRIAPRLGTLHPVPRVEDSCVAVCRVLSFMDIINSP